VEEETNEEAKEKEATQLAHTSPAHRQIQETLRKKMTIQKF
jgi:hypothetical protein